MDIMNLTIEFFKLFIFVIPRELLVQEYLKQKPETVQQPQKKESQGKGNILMVFTFKPMVFFLERGPISHS